MDTQKENRIPCKASSMREKCENNICNSTQIFLCVWIFKLNGIRYCIPNEQVIAIINQLLHIYTMWCHLQGRGKIFFPHIQLRENILLDFCSTKILQTFFYRGHTSLWEKLNFSWSNWLRRTPLYSICTSFGVEL